MLPTHVLTHQDTTSLTDDYPRAINDSQTEANYCVILLTAYCRFNQIPLPMCTSVIRGATLMTLVGGVLRAIFGSVGGLVGTHERFRRTA